MVSKSTRLELTKNSRPQAMAATSATEREDDIKTSVAKDLEKSVQDRVPAAAFPTDLTKTVNGQQGKKNSVTHRVTAQGEEPTTTAAALTVGDVLHAWQTPWQCDRARGSKGVCSQPWDSTWTPRCRTLESQPWAVGVQTDGGLIPSSGAEDAKTHFQFRE